jgi:hypothetical protein
MNQPDQIMILVKGLNNRVQYVLRHVFFKVMGVRPVITNDREAFQACTYAKLNYTYTRIADEAYMSLI